MHKHHPGEHAYAFGAYLAAMIGGLLAVRSLPYLALYLALLGMMIWLHQRHRITPTPQRFAHAQLFYPIALNTAFPAMGGAVPAIRIARYDDALLLLDQEIFGMSPNVWMEQFVTPQLTELMSLCYLFFMPLLYFSLIRYFFWRKALLAPFYRGLFSVYGIGFLGYLLVPAAGPYLAYPEMFGTPLEGGPITALTQAMVLAGSNRVDVFPSLHCAVSAYILGFAYRYRRNEFWWILAPVAGLWISTIYLRYHYFVDVIFGFALAIACLTIVWRDANPSSQTGELDVPRTEL
jgi:membrane-associated phospholipid phosphatase